MSDPIIPKAKRIPGAKLGDDGIWRDQDGKELTNAELIKLRKAAQKAAEKAKS